MPIKIHDLYSLLLKKYGYQGWWPLLRLNDYGNNPTLRGHYTGYHPGNYEIPSSYEDVFEIMIGSILAQNTSWINAEKALNELYKRNLLDIQKLRDISLEYLAESIRSSGYYNQKAIKIKNLIQFLENNPISILLEKPVEELRKSLISVKGIGPETADSIILYALKKPIFVIDAYTKRLSIRLGFVEHNPEPSYQELQDLFQSVFDSDANLFNEFHALIVQHCVHVCEKKPKCENCLLTKNCPKIIIQPVKRKKSRKTNSK